MLPREPLEAGDDGIAVARLIFDQPSDAAGIVRANALSGKDVRVGALTCLVPAYPPAPSAISTAHPR
jgi:hypothetical protein